MDTVLRSAAVYIFLLVIFRISGKRSLSQITTFDFILLLIISEATQQALVGNDFSIVNTCVVVASLVVLDITFSWMENRWTDVRARRRQPAGGRRRVRPPAGGSREARRSDAARNPHRRPRDPWPRAAGSIQVRDSRTPRRHQRGADGEIELRDLVCLNAETPRRRESGAKST